MAMETQVFQLNNEPYDPALIQAAASIITGGGLLAFPTETVYGLGANGLDPDAVKRIFQAKGRPSDNPLILHLARTEDLELYCTEIPHTAWDLARRFWPGPLTMVLRCKDSVPEAVTGGLSTVGVRCPDHPLAQRIIEAAGVPVAAPSANRSGRPSPTMAAHVLEDMDGRIEGIADGGDCPVGVESTIVDLTACPPRLLRPGGVSLEALELVLGQVTVDEAVLGPMEAGITPQAPGMKYRHYAPKAPVTVVEGPYNETAFCIKEAAGPRDGILCFSEYEPLFTQSQVYSLGSVADGEDQAKHLFDLLRRFDKAPVEEIYAQCPNGDGVGFAVGNRLKKAAGFHVISVPPATKETVIGITGGTGAGKTSALRVLGKWGGCIIDCDAVYHMLLAKDQEMIRALTSRFGDILGPDGGVDRKKLGQVVFGDSEALLELNGLTHGFVEKEVLRQMDTARGQGISIMAIDAIALIESGISRFCHKVVGVIAPEALRIARIVRREGIDTAYAKLRIGAQKPDSFFREQCDLILENTSDDLFAFEHKAMELFYSILKENAKGDENV